MKRVISIFFSLFLILFFISCGSSSSGGSSPTTTATYKGAMDEGDYAEITVSNGTFSYSFEGHYFPSGTSGSLDAEQISVGSATPFYYLENSSTLIGNSFIGENLVFADLDSLGPGGSDISTVALAEGTTPTESNVLGTYVVIDTGGEVITWEVASGGDLTITNITSSITTDACWQLDSTTHTLNAWEASSCTTVPSTFDYTVYIKPSSSRKATVIDFVDGSGIASGLEQSSMTISSSKTFYMMCTDGGNLYKITVAAASGDGLPTWEWFEENGSSWDSLGTGTIVVNKDCDDNAVNGVGCAAITAGTEIGSKFAIMIDLDEGYFMARDESGIDRCCYGGSN